MSRDFSNNIVSEKFKKEALGQLFDKNCHFVFIKLKNFQQIFWYFDKNILFFPILI